jgi:outer membrane receptor protein involved in Fe transport
MNTLLKNMLLGGSATALIAAATMTAQAQAQQSGNAIETVEVSSSRLNLQGFQAPTPVTVIGIESIERNAHINIGDEIRDIPQVGGASTERANTANIAQANAGIDTLSLRNLGAGRNLVLFDGQRSAISGIQDGTVDLQTIPTSMVQRIDVVTGGASAAWGSDALTGVINVVINKNFTGAKANVEFSDNLRVSVPRYNLSGGWGTDFLDGKGHVQVGATWTISNTATFNGQNAPWNRGRTNVYNPAYCAAGAVTYTGTATTNGTCSSPTGARALMYVYNAGPSTYTQGGLVNGNSAGAPGSGLAVTTQNTPNINAGLQGLQGQMFVGSGNVTTSNFNYGTQYNTTCYNGCTNNQFTSGNNAFGLSAIPYHQSNVFVYASYQLPLDIKMGVQLAQGKYSTRVKGTLNNSTSQTIYADNAYLPASIAQRFVCNPSGVPAAGPGTATCAATLSNGYNPYTFQNESSAYLTSGGTLTALSVAARQAAPSQRLIMGFDFSNNRRQPSTATQNVGAGNPQQSDDDVWNMNNVCSAIGEACGFYNRVYNRASVNFEGSIGSDWTWSAYAAWSGLRQRETAPNNPFRTRFANAIDAVRVTSGNQGTSGLPVGSVQCRGLLNPANLTAATAKDDLIGCVPVNVFGSGNVSQAAYNWISPGVDPSSGYLDTVTVKTGQSAAGGEVSGVLPWSLPAGDILVATGFDYRLEQAGQYDVPAFSTRNILVAGNWSNYSGQYNVKEAFVEANLPVLKDMIVQTLDINLAGRFTSYSTSGDVQTWKIGINSQITDDVRVRGFLSSDIRAPTIYELFNPSGVGNQQDCANWVQGVGTNRCSALTGGNINLKPEQANTSALGLVFTPTFIPGLTASLDWYDIRMHGFVSSLGFADVINRAKAGETQYCSAIITADGTNICSYSQTAGTTGVPQITSVLTGFVNAARVTRAGFDANINYGFDLFTGQMDIGVNANYTYDASRDLNGVYYQGEGATGGYYSGGANFGSTISLTYREGAWTFGANIHVTGDAVRNPIAPGEGVAIAGINYSRFNGVDYGNTTAGQQGQGFLPTNYAPWSADIGGRIQYRLSDMITIYGAMDRVFPGNKSYRVGARFRF